MYWSKKEGSLAKLIDKADSIGQEKIEELGKKAKKRIEEDYTWEKIAGKYERIFLSERNS